MTKEQEIRLSHLTYGGRIYSSDYETEYSGDNHLLSTVAARISADWNFDRNCEKRHILDEQFRRRKKC